MPVRFQKISDNLRYLGNRQTASAVSTEDQQSGLPRFFKLNLSIYDNVYKLKTILMMNFIPRNSLENVRFP